MSKAEEFIFENLPQLALSLIILLLFTAHLTQVGQTELNGKIVAKSNNVLVNRITVSLTTEGESIQHTISSFCNFKQIKLNKPVNIVVTVPLIGCKKLKIKEL